MSNQPTVSDIFRRAMEIRQSNANISYNEIKSRLVSEFSGKTFPNPTFLTIPEYDNIAPEEDWTAGLPIVLRGIQTEDWNEIAHGIIISLEQVETPVQILSSRDQRVTQWKSENTLTRGKT